VKGTAKWTANLACSGQRISHNQTANLACSGQRFLHVVDSETRMFFCQKNPRKALQRSRKSIEPNSHRAFIGYFIGFDSCAHADACLPHKSRKLLKNLPCKEVELSRFPFRWSHFPNP
jgi:hypothetical protein